MARIEGIRIKNYKSLKDVTLGKILGSDKDRKALTPLTVVIGKNGVGKSTLFDVFGFLSDSLQFGVQKACDNRGGFETIRSRGQTGDIEFEIYYRESKNARPISYNLAVGKNKNGKIIVKSERLRQRRKDQPTGQPYSFLYLKEGKGFAWKGTDGGKDIPDENIPVKALMETSDQDAGYKEKIELEDPRKLGIVTLGSLKQHPRISAFRKFIEGWYVSYFTPDAARTPSLVSKSNDRLDIHGENLSNYVQYLESEHKEILQDILQNIAKKLPDIESVSTAKTQDNRLLLCFNNKYFTQPFYANQTSDGTLKVFAYMLLLHAPSPASFLCIEEPENGVYHKLLETLASEFREYAKDTKKKSQVFITTHQPYFVNALNPDEVWIMKKGEDGFSTLERASDNTLILNLTEEELPLGNLWYSDYLDA